MFYPQEFKDRVKKAYPDRKDLHQLLDDGDRSVGCFLDHKAVIEIHLRDILAATSLEELQEEARTIQKSRELFLEWNKLDREQNPNG